MSALAAIAFALAGIHIGVQHVLPVGQAPAWSPSGARIAYITRGNLWVADADGTHQALLERGANNPVWAPNGRRLAFSRNGLIWTVRADGNDERRLARGDNPAWSPHGERIAYDDGEVFSVRWSGGQRHELAVGTEPAYAPDGQMAFVRDGSVIVEGRAVALGDQPTWAPDSKRLAYVHDGTIYLAGHALTRGTDPDPDWRPAARVQELLPDLVQRPPSDLVVAGQPGHWLLGFTSLVDNVGLGPLMIVGVRPPAQKRMTATQHVLLANGKWTTYPGVEQLRYTNSQPHFHWHLMRYDSYELRSLTGKLLIRDRKAGFCLADHYGIAPGNWNRHPRFLGNCQEYNPEAKRVVMGTSLGYTDRYPAFFAGQNDNITGLVGGVYDLVHRVNSNMALHELRYENDAASVRIRISWQDGTPTVKVLQGCPGKAVC